MEKDNGSVFSSNSYCDKSPHQESTENIPSKSHHRPQSILKRTNILSRLFSKKNFRINKTDNEPSNTKNESVSVAKLENDSTETLSNSCLTFLDEKEQRMESIDHPQHSNKASSRECNGNSIGHSDDFHISVALGHQVFVPRASTESLDHLEESPGCTDPPIFKPTIPTIHENIGPLLFDNNNSTQSPSTSLIKNHLLCPPPYHRDFSRKSSTEEDSAVDMKFHDDDTAICHSSSSCNTDSSFLFSETDSMKASVKKSNESADPWSMVRNIIVPFVQHSHKRKYPWIQLSGHQGNFRSGAQGTILKKLCPQEAECLEDMMSDPLSKFVPQYKGITEKDAEKYVEMEDLLLKFENPSIMDCKIGVRTYLEHELNKARKDPIPRKDMYDKMIEVDPNEPTQEEHGNQAVTKPRYMQWRETISSSSELGFRIEGYKKYDQLTACDFKRIKTKEHLTKNFAEFVDSTLSIVEQYLDRLNKIRRTCEESSFFKSHEFIGSSLLFVYDKYNKANIWMIDFGKTRTVEALQSINHRAVWIEGNHEDGYLTGLDNIIEIFETVRRNIVDHGQN